MQQAIHQSARPVARCRVHDQTRRFVDHKDIRILVHQTQRQRLRLNFPGIVSVKIDR